MLDADQPFHNLYPRCSKSCPSVISQKISKYEELFRDFHPYYSGQGALFTTLSTVFQKQLFGSKSKPEKMKKPFSLAFPYYSELTGSVTTLSTVFQKQLLNNKRSIFKIWKAILKIDRLFARS
ncbi:hypothetical protein [Enterococcus villorum]|uniref:hypothetical protein n=1 Tax=Enterococcus villorum TaxID=112904 RepID=UPI0009C0EF1C|nr:hypothetical protein [Enterococcus villorum]